MKQLSENTQFIVDSMLASVEVSIEEGLSLEDALIDAYTSHKAAINKGKADIDADLLDGFKGKGVVLKRVTALFNEIESAL